MPVGSKAAAFSPATTRAMVTQSQRLRDAIGSPEARRAAAAVQASRAAAATLPDGQFYGWDALLGVQPLVRDLAEAGACGGGGCNASFDNSQFWDMHVACSADVYARVLFQWSRYEAARARLTTLLANVPQRWVRDLYFADTRDAQGRSTSMPTMPAGQQPMGAKANEWADWSMEVARCIAVARWATNVSWCMGERTPDFYLGGPVSWHVKTSPVWADRGERVPTPAELGTCAAAQGREPRMLDVASTNVLAGAYPPDAARAIFGGYHPQGYFRGTSPRGAGPSRWTFGSAATPTGRAAFLDAGVCEVHPGGSSDALRARSREAFGDWGGDVGAFNPYVPGANNQQYTPTMIQFSEALRLRRGANAGGRWVMPSRKEDWDPVVAPWLTVGRGGGTYWPLGVRAPRSLAPRDVLVALYLDARTTDADAHAGDRVRPFALNQGVDAYLPSGLRQAWWLMGHAYDVIDTSLGDVVSTAFHNMLTAMQQIPEAYRVNVPSGAVELARSLQQGNLETGLAIMSGVSTGALTIVGIVLDVAVGAVNAAATAAAVATATAAATAAGETAAAAAAIGTAAGASASVPVAGWIVGAVLAIIAALVAVASALASNAIGLGLARMEAPPILPQIIIRTAGATEDPTDPCWLATPQRAGGGGPASMTPKYTAVRDAAAAGSDPALWYARVRDAIADGTMQPPSTAPTINKGLVAVGGVIAGLALIKLVKG